MNTIGSVMSAEPMAGIHWASPRRQRRLKRADVRRNDLVDHRDGPEGQSGRHAGECPLSVGVLPPHTQEEHREQNGAGERERAYPTSAAIEDAGLSAANVVSAQRARSRGEAADEDLLALCRILVDDVRVDVVADGRRAGDEQPGDSRDRGGDTARRDEADEPLGRFDSCAASTTTTSLAAPVIPDRRRSG